MNAPPEQTGPGGVRRRTWLTEPGEALLLSASAIEDLSRADALERQSGLNPADVVLSRLCSVALPSPDVPHGDANRPWESFDPEFAWHPFAWLPARLKTRLPIPGARYADDGGQVFENDDQFAARVALELSASGIYDVETGTWLDVMSLYEIDLDTPEGMARVQAWFAGDFDFDLDTVDLSVYIDVPDDPDWALGLVLDLEEALVPASMCKAAEDLIAVIAAAVDDDQPERMAFDLHVAAISAVHAFCTMGLAQTESWRADAAYAQAWQSEASLHVLANSMRSKLTAIFEANRAAVDAVGAYFAEIETDGTDFPEGTAVTAAQLGASQAPGNGYRRP